MAEDPHEYYKPPKVPEFVRYNLKENSYPPGTNRVELEQPSGKLVISAIDLHRSKQEIISDGDSKFVVLLDSGKGSVVRTDENKNFPIDGVPAIFYVARNKTLLIDGDFSGWLMELRQTVPDDLEDRLPNITAAIVTSPPIREKIFKQDELQGKQNPLAPNRFSSGQGEMIRWVMGQWNSVCPLNVALGIGGIGSYGDEMQREPGVVEIHLINRGRSVYHIEDDTGKRFDFPARAGDVTVISPNTYFQRERYSAFSEFCIKWGAQPGKLIDPTEKVYKTTGNSL